MRSIYLLNPTLYGDSKCARTTRMIWLYHSGSSRFHIHYISVKTHIVKKMWTIITETGQFWPTCPPSQAPNLWSHVDVLTARYHGKDSPTGYILFTAKSGWQSRLIELIRFDLPFTWKSQYRSNGRTQPPGFHFPTYGSPRTTNTGMSHRSGTCKKLPYA